jgi:Protein of unknown function (DUF4242)
VQLLLKENHVPRFMIERNFAEQLEVTGESAATVKRINDEEGVEWLFSFLSADKKKTYCLYEAPSADAIRAAARRANLPANVIIEPGIRHSSARAPARSGSGRSACAGL